MHAPPQPTRPCELRDLPGNSRGMDDEIETTTIHTLQAGSMWVLVVGTGALWRELRGSKILKVEGSDFMGACTHMCHMNKRGLRA